MEEKWYTSEETYLNSVCGSDRQVSGYPTLHKLV